jgi:hypothetical protein
MVVTTLLQRLRRSRATRTVRALWFALALLVLGVQTALPAHQESHHLGQADSLCQYCVLGGHLYSLTSTPPAIPAPALHWEAPGGVSIAFVVSPFPRTVFSRGPPSAIDA